MASDATTDNLIAYAQLRAGAQLTVGELLSILSRLDPSLPIATHANNHTFLDMGGFNATRVASLHTYAGDFVLIGNPSKMDLNGRNEHIACVIDGGPPLPMNWPGEAERRIMVNGYTPLGCERCEGPGAK